MRYRDERDALRHRADHLSDELRTAEQRLHQTEQRLAEHEQKDARDEEELARLRAEVERLRRKAGEVPAPSRRQPKIALTVAGSLAALVFAGGVAGFLLLGSSTAPPQDVVAVAPADTPAEPPAAIPAQRTFWGGEVIASEGGKAKIGDGCLVEAALAPGGRASDLVVRCGRATLYRASQPTGDGVIQLDGGHAELAHGDQRLHILRYRNTGDWSGPRAQLDIDSAKHRARVFKTGADAWSVTIHLADLSFPRKGPALAPDAAKLSDVAWTRRTARRTAITGPAPPSVADSASCELTVHPTPPQRYEGQTLTCRVTLRCGGSIVYGAGTTGYVACPHPGDPLAIIVDEGDTEQNDDPKLTVDLAGNLATVEDGPLGATWTARYELSEPKSCLSDGAWTGQRGSGEKQAALTLAIHPGELEIIVDRGEAGPTFELPNRCTSNALDLRGDGAPHLFVGPGGATLGGYDASKATPMAFLRVASP